MRCVAPADYTYSVKPLPFSVTCQRPASGQWPASGFTVTDYYVAPDCSSPTRSLRAFNTTTTVLPVSLPVLEGVSFQPELRGFADSLVCGADSSQHRIEYSYTTATRVGVSFASAGVGCSADVATLGEL